MHQRRLRRDVPPWSFFLPVTLAVLVGMLAAEFITLALAAIFSRDTPVEAVAAPAPLAPVGATTEVAEDGASTVEVGPPLAGELPSLPGPSSALRDGDARACINGTVVARRPNGWEQGLENDAPVRCIAASP
jgi:hypothetical protein